MDREEFVSMAVNAGFDEDMSDFMYEHLATRPHTHSLDEIVGLEEQLDEIADKVEDDEDEEE